MFNPEPGFQSQCSKRKGVPALSRLTKNFRSFYPRSGIQNKKQGWIPDPGGQKGNGSRIRNIINIVLQKFDQSCTLASSVADPDLHHFGNFGRIRIPTKKQDPHQSEKSDPDLHSHQIKIRIRVSIKEKSGSATKCIFQLQNLANANPDLLLHPTRTWFLLFS